MYLMRRFGGRGRYRGLRIRTRLKVYIVVGFTGGWPIKSILLF
jgi:hypothetical protein